RRALELLPGDAYLMRGMAMLLGNLTRHDEALALIRRAVALDPLSAGVYRTLARVCIYAGILDEGEAAAKKSLELDPQAGVTPTWIGLACLRQGRLDEALDWFQRETHEAFRLLGRSLLEHARGRRADSDATL